MAPILLLPRTNDLSPAGTAILTIGLLSALAIILILVIHTKCNPPLQWRLYKLKPRPNPKLESALASPAPENPAPANPALATSVPENPASKNSALAAATCSCNHDSGHDSVRDAQQVQAEYIICGVRTKKKDRKKKEKKSVRDKEGRKKKENKKKKIPRLEKGAGFVVVPMGMSKPAENEVSGPAPDATPEVAPETVPEAAPDPAPAGDEVVPVHRESVEELGYYTAEEGSVRMKKR